MNQRRLDHDQEDVMVTVNRAKDFVERVVWTAVQAAAAAALATGFDNWNLTAKVAGLAALAAALKVLVAQNVGVNKDGAAIPGGVIETSGGK